ncbi:MAG: hypothetical protein LAT64_07495 [Phycisphaerales bacterium]|nr:hypothetical protein [Planctomycetota bacterium]MCH8508600.1 hypothetical protein [Phycisphaerales bacterium]
MNKLPIAGVTCAALLGVCGSLVQADIVIYESAFHTGVAGSEWSNQKVDTIPSPWYSFLGNFGQETVTLTLGRASGGSGSGGSGGGLDGVTGVISPTPIYSNRSGSGGARSDGRFLKTASRPVNGGGGGGNGGGNEPNPGVAAGEYSLIFDLYLFDSWDGYDPTYGVDRFKVAVNGEILFNEVFRTFAPWESSLSEGWIIPGSHAYDPTYRDVIYPELEIRFTVNNPGELLVIDFIGAATQPIWDESWGLDHVKVIYHGDGRMVPAAPTALALVGGLLVGSRRRR